MLANVNDHVVRISVMTQPYHWHLHPHSDEMLLVIEGGLIIEFEPGELQLSSGQMATVPRGVLHRTRPLGRWSVNLTFEAANGAKARTLNTGENPILLKMKMEMDPAGHGRASGRYDQLRDRASNAHGYSSKLALPNSAAAPESSLLLVDIERCDLVEARRRVEDRLVIFIQAV